MSPRLTDVVVLCWETPTTDDRHACKIVEFMGATVTLVTLTSTGLNGGRIRALVPTCACVIVAAETVARVSDTIAGPISDLAAFVLVYGFQPTERQGALLREWSSGQLVGVEPLRPADATFQVASGARDWCGQFSGLSVGGADPARDSRFLEQAGAMALDPLIRVGADPFFVRLANVHTQIFLLACATFADLDEGVGRHARPLPWFSRLVPLMMFLRGALKDLVWHNDSPRACLIVDDPQLTSGRYGFLNYAQLVDVMQRRRCSTSIAFIPWNYRRSNRDVAALVASNRRWLSLCVHGCDHVDSEFAQTDVNMLRQKAHTALDRMKAHRRLSGVPFDDVMVFPQGRFSAEAIVALKAAGYLATVNGDVSPANAPQSPTLRSWLEVAVTTYSDFPLFGRRYPREIAEFAFDLFVGKPALAVEHHRYFERGYERLESFVEQLNGLDAHLEWSDLGTICSRACLTRIGDDGDVHVRFFTDRFIVQNVSSEPRRYQLFRGRPRDERHQQVSVTIDGRTNECDRVGDDLKIVVNLMAGQQVEVSLSSLQRDAVGPVWRETARYRANVRARRLMGEFRDNYVDPARTLITRFLLGGHARRAHRLGTDTPVRSQRS